MKTYSKKQIDEVANELKSGKIVALPTETVYGLAVTANSINAIKNLSLLKNRQANKIYALMLADVKQMPDFVVVDKFAQKIIREYLPDALTVILPKSQSCKNEYFNNYSTIGVRVPDDDFLQRLSAESGPIIITSANMSGETPCQTSDEVIKKMPKVDVVVKGKAGDCLPTTVVELKNGKIIVHRKGELELAGHIDK